MYVFNVHAGVVGRVLGAVVVAVAPQQVLSWKCGNFAAAAAAALLRPSLCSALPSVLQQQGVQHVACVRDRQRRRLLTPDHPVPQGRMNSSAGSVTAGTNQTSAA